MSTTGPVRAHEPQSLHRQAKLSECGALLVWQTDFVSNPSQR